MLTCLFYPLSKPVSPGKTGIFAKEPAAKLQNFQQTAFALSNSSESQRLPAD